MTAATLTHLPFAAGSAVLTSLGRTALWAFSHYRRAPLANTAIFSMVTLTALAGSNALYFQTQKHPAPLFAPIVEQASLAPEAAPVVPAIRPLRPVLAPLPAAETVTGSIAADVEPIGNAEVFELQRKLATLQLFTGTIDGYYGPQTASAIRKFEELNGLRPLGELSPEIIEAVRNAPVVSTTPDPVVLREPAALAVPKQQVQGLQPLAQRQPQAAVTPRAATTISPLPAPAPLQVDLQAAASQPPTTPMGRELPETPQEAMNLAVDTAGEALDTIVEGVQVLTRRPARPTAAVQRFAPVPESSIGASEPSSRLAMATPVAIPGKPLVVAEPVPAAEVPVLDTDARPEELMPAFSVTDPVIVARVQRGLGSLGFLHGAADGVAGEATAKAIRNFEVYYNYNVTGRISPELLDLLVQNGASI